MGYVPTDYDKYFNFNLVDFSQFDINIEPPTPPPLPPSLNLPNRAVAARTEVRESFGLELNPESLLIREEVLSVDDSSEILDRNSENSPEISDELEDIHQTLERTESLIENSENSLETSEELKENSQNLKLIENLVENNEKSQEFSEELEVNSQNIEKAESLKENSENSSESCDRIEENSLNLKLIENFVENSEKSQEFSEESEVNSQNIEKSRETSEESEGNSQDIERTEDVLKTSKLLVENTAESEENTIKIEISDNFLEILNKLSENTKNLEEGSIKSTNSESSEENFNTSPVKLEKSHKTPRNHQSISTSSSLTIKNNQKRAPSAEIDVNFNFDIVTYDINGSKMKEKAVNELISQDLKVVDSECRVSLNEDEELSIEKQVQAESLEKNIESKNERPENSEESSGNTKEKLINSESARESTEDASQISDSDNFFMAPESLSDSLQNDTKVEEMEIADDQLVDERTEPEKASEFDNIPMEIIIHILKFLNPSDLKYAALVCRRFLSACTYKKLNKRFMLHFVDSYYKQFAVQISHFVDTYRPFPAISLSTGNFDISSQNFWWDYGLNVEEIYFRNGILRKQEFEDIIRWTPHLKVLKIESNSIFTTWKIRSDYSERILKFENCHHISLARNSFINRKIFDYVVFKAPHLRELDLSHCLGKMNGRDRMQILDHLIFYLKGYGGSIKGLNLSHTPTDDFFLQQLAEIRCLKLKSLSLTFNGCVTNPKHGLIPLLRAQDELEDLDLSESPAVEEIILMEISHLKRLKRLALKKCSHVTDYSLMPVSKCANLVALDITSCDLVTDAGIHDSLMVGTPKKHLRELYFALLSNITEVMFVRLGSKFHEQITHLDLGGSTNLADDALQTIFCHFTKIRFLNLDSCCKISDYGLTGKFQNQMYFSISNLRGLRVFRMQNCYKVTDFALKDSFHFAELRELYMARTHFSREGIESMVATCPAIEILDLAEVEGVDDDCVEAIVRKLRRLHTLKLNGNEKLTSRIFDHIYAHCEDIKYLYLRNCPNLATDRLTDQLYLMRSLRKVYLE